MRRIDPKPWLVALGAALAACQSPEPRPDARLAVFGTRSRGERESRATTLELHGTAFVVHPCGLLITCSHNLPLKSPSEVQVLSGGESFPARVLAIHPVLDLALLGIEVSRPLRALALAERDIRVHERIGVLGFPRVADEERHVQIRSGQVLLTRHRARVAVRGRERIYSDLIATDAPVYEGWSGGPVVDERGDVVGIVVLAAGPPGEPGPGYALRASSIRGVLEDWIRRFAPTGPGAAVPARPSGG